MKKDSDKKIPPAILGSHCASGSPIPDIVQQKMVFTDLEVLEEFWTNSMLDHNSLYAHEMYGEEHSWKT